MIASLPMYVSPRTDAAEARLWAVIRDTLRRTGLPAPDALTRAIPDLRAHWQDPALLLSQTCGMPYRLWLHGQVRLVGTPDYALPGCPPGHYRSVVIAREDDPRGGLRDFTGAPFAYNEPHSQSGWAALANEAPDVLTGPRLRTGAHRASAAAVREGRADVAAIDAVTWRLLSAEGAAKGLRVVHETPPTPGLPLITAAARDPEPIRDAVAQAIATLARTDRSALGLHGLVTIPAAAYLAVPNPKAPAPES